MAWSRDLRRKCRCGRTATHEVLNNRNESHGPYCEKCAAAEVKRLTKQEAEMHG